MYTLLKALFVVVRRGCILVVNELDNPVLQSGLNKLGWQKNHIDRDLSAVEKALRIIASWNRANFSEKMIRLNIPEPWTISGKRCLVEPYIHGFFKMNSNTGWVHDCNRDYDSNSDDDDDEHEDFCDTIDMLQALSHFSYHVSNGQFVLCDLQGGIFRDGVILTDPAILSCDSRFGLTDLGPEGISSFFYSHQCNRYCSDDWLEPRDQRPYYHLRSTTTMSFGH